MIFPVIFIFIFCLILAFLEVQIEGNEGWALNLPTWRPFKHKWYSKLYSKILKGKELTGYHIGIYLLTLVSVHGFYFYELVWNWRSEFQVLAIFFLIAVVWDYLWFVLNPHYGWKNFKPAKVAWHKSWLGPWPVDYYYGLLLFIILFTLSWWPAWYLGLTNGLSLLFWIIILVIGATLIRIIIDNRKNLLK